MVRATNKLDADGASLKKTALVSSSVLLASLLFWGSLAPRLLLSKTAANNIDDADAAVADICLWSGFCATTILIGHFAMLYLWSVRRGKPFAFVVYWFIASLFFDAVWEIPLWGTALFSSGPSRIPFLSVDHLPYAIYWWSYSISDVWYVEVTPLVVAAEIWYLLGNLFGVWGLYSYHCFSDKRQRQQPRLHEENKILASFCICGILQCCNATLYMFCGWYIDGFESVHPSWRGKYIYWGLNGFWALASAVAAHTSWNLLFSSNDGERNGKRE